MQRAVVQECLRTCSVCTTVDGQVSECKICSQVRGICIPPVLREAMSLATDIVIQVRHPPISVNQQDVTSHGSHVGCTWVT